MNKKVMDKSVSKGRFVEIFPIVRPDSPSVREHRKRIQKITRPLIQEQDRQYTYFWNIVLSQAP